MRVNGVDVTGIKSELVNGVLSFTGDTKFYDLKMQEGQIELSVWHLDHSGRHNSWADGAMPKRVSQQAVCS